MPEQLTDDELDALASRLGGKKKSTGGKMISFLTGGGSSKKRLFGNANPELYGAKSGSMQDIHNISFGGRSIYPRLGHKEEMAIEASGSDTKTDLVDELVNQGGLTRRAAEETVNGLITKGVLVEQDDPDLGKVLVFRHGG